MPFLPIRGEAEQKLAHRLLREAVARNESLSNMSLLERICSDWNTNHLSVANKIYPKLPYHFTTYIKRWKKNQSRRDAGLSSGANTLNQVLELVPAANGPNGNNEMFQPAPLNSTPTDGEAAEILNSTPTDGEVTEIFPTDSNPAESNLGTDAPTMEPQPAALAMIARAAATQVCLPVNEEQDPIIPNRRRCMVPGCQDRYKCPGPQGRSNCNSKTGGDPTKKKKRKITKTYTKKCAVCRIQGCPGVNGCKKCINK